MSPQCGMLEWSTQLPSKIESTFKADKKCYQALCLGHIEIHKVLTVQSTFVLKKKRNNILYGDRILHLGLY